MNRLELLVFKVGHGLSVALIEKPENYVILVDLGASAGFTPLKYMALDLGIKPDILYITHPHADHLDDIETALNRNFRPLGLNYQLYDWDDVKNREREELRDKIDSFLTLQRIVPFAEYAGSAKLEVWRFTPADAQKNFGDDSYVNNSSYFFVYAWRGFKIAVAGDLESDGMDATVATEAFQKSAKGAQILIPSHHGHSNGFPSQWVEKIGRPCVSIISIQERDEHIDSRYSSSDFARGVKFAGKTRYRLTTRADGSIRVSMWYSEEDKALWRFESF